MSATRAFPFCTVLLAAVATFAVALHAQLPSPRLDTAFPLGARAGSEIEVTLTGSDLTEPSALFFDADGITATKIDGLKFRVAVAANCSRGLHEMRLAGKYGVSTPLPFVVGDAPELIDPGTNHSLQSAVTISVPEAVEGRVEAEQRDFYKFSARKEQLVHIACSACVLDSAMDPVITVLDAKGATVARADDDLDRDALLAFVAPTDGDFFLEVHDKLFGGGANYGYRLSLSSEPAFPLPLLTPASVVDESWSELRPIAEVEPNDNAAAAQQLQIPAAVDGRFDSDWFTFHGDPARPLWLEVVADREHPPCDPLLVVYKITHDKDGEQSKRMAELDDLADLPAPPLWQAASRDPMGRFVPDEAGEYRISVVDRFRGNGKYRLILREATADFALLGLGESLSNEEKKIFRWQPNIRKGGSAYFHVAVLRRGFDGDVLLRAEGLPEGITTSGSIPAGSSTGILTFRASTDAKSWSGYFRVFGEGGGVRRELRCVHYRWNVDNRDNQRVAARLAHCAIGIVDEAAPIVIALSDPQPRQASIGADLEIPLEFSRPNELAMPKGEWQIAPANFPGLKKIDPVKFDGATAKEAKVVLHLQKDGNALKPGLYSIVLRARGTVAYKADPKAQARDLKHIEFSAPVAITISDAPAAATAAAQ